MPEPIVTVWRNRIPHPCSLLYWGRRWKFIGGRPRRLANLRRMHVWSAHAPVIGGERLVIDTRHLQGWHSFHCYHDDGSPVVIVGCAEHLDD